MPTTRNKRFAPFPNSASDPNIVRNNLIRSKPPGSEIDNQDGAKPLPVSADVLNQDSFFCKPIDGRFSAASQEPGNC
jgi:hypothetical protein